MLLFITVRRKIGVIFLQAWLDALEEHSAYSTHYCSQDQGSEEEEEEGMSLGELTDSLQAAEVSQKKLEKEVAAFLSMLKNDGLSERKTCYFTIISGGGFLSLYCIISAWVTN
ncbi:hypothetical protein ATANTOWER_023588 [Ataeniobius toweri]|uniref:Uncharacterized protein n=1 Tax=Ataeniobius toweri TaxID=208326 RepID=A0ABU7A874_9TELE|nr:hypothetical protein [Ataeniobius toweri]